MGVTLALGIDIRTNILVTRQDFHFYWDTFGMYPIKSVVIYIVESQIQPNFHHLKIEYFF